jgi:hypothetical protein
MANSNANKGSNSAAYTNYDATELLRQLRNAIATLRFNDIDKVRLDRSCGELVGVFDRCPGKTLQDRWLHFETNVWPGWLRNDSSRPPEHRWTWGVRVVVMARLVVPSWEWTCHVHLLQWIYRLSEADPLFQQYQLLRNAANELPWAADISRIKAIRNGLRIMLTRGYTSLEEITDADVSTIPADAKGVDTLDGMLCLLGVFTRHQNAERRARVVLNASTQVKCSQSRRLQIVFCRQPLSTWKRIPHASATLTPLSGTKRSHSPTSGASCSKRTQKSKHALVFFLNMRVRTSYMLSSERAKHREEA